MSDKFKIGDIVQLKSGGPRMTVTRVEKAHSGESKIHTTWFVESKPENSVFPFDAIAFCKEEQSEDPEV
ncbi:hypothetical protein SKTS_13980 [Sulfurimicrobium lacus]|uniref:DUF2158 domain-containing protein n=1 Tax=Sulfurimicrobium lacus TaxID=2715678 RepID=A0A6F8VC18_9PROT|nr:DUF2158 domain-containing protein [Sulfurimicrobium lacus]BCB26512.1 hypothetical protein SKTS_13980 [Sulfurimicrobium lacus]